MWQARLVCLSNYFTLEVMLSSTGSLSADVQYSTVQYDKCWLTRESSDTTHIDDD